jgi:SSS family solute:Na+ symporter
VNLMSLLYLGALAVSGISGLNVYTCIVLLSVFSIVITLGGMKVIGYTDVIQVFFLILGGLVATYIALHLVAEKSGQTGLLNGFKLLTSEAGDHFHMIFKKDSPNYVSLPGLSVLIGGMWIVNLNYWGCNQYITQRALGADLKTARSGILFAAFLKMLMPVIVVLPGIGAYVLYQKGMFHSTMLSSSGAVDVNKAYPNLLSLLPVGFKGVAFAALTAAIVASLAGKANSIATIFTLDIYKKAINPNADEKKQVMTGKIAVVVSMAMAVLMSLVIGEKLMGEGKQGFNYIQEYTGFVSPGIFAMFLLGFFWKRTTAHAAMFAMIGGLALSCILKFLPLWVNLDFLTPFGFYQSNPDNHGAFEIPFLDRMGFVFLFCIAGMAIINLVENKRGVVTKGLEVDASMFKVSKSFAVGALVIVGMLITLYTVFW